MRHLSWLLFSLFCLTVNADDATPVSTATPTQSAIAETLSLSGSLTAEKQAMLSPRVDGLVKSVLVDAGYEVNQGDLLIQLDPAIASQQYAQTQAATAEAEAARNEAQRLVNEAESLRKKNYISESELANRQSNLALAEAALVAAKATERAALEQLRRHDLPAPFSGVISAKMTEAGEWVNRGTAVLELVATDKVRLDVKVPQEQFSSVSQDSPVEVIPDVYPNRRLPGQISAIVPVSDPQARAFLVRVVVDASDIDLLPGTSATAVIGLNGDGGQKLLIPRDALLLHPDGGYSVFVVNNDVAERRQVTIGQQSQSGVSVLEGLEADARVVIRGNEVLRDGQSVTVVNP
ncbi:efflux RND transporter periplasmic adaptor subunit [Methylophaga sp.]|jgi:RND family efflux transporter MFP subunit|uniref:efflux RND transporter periplasmic adaptor subunit n=1 Tax=Methylophaga sp. TaxID=2024840 RepID=UPI001401A211|nr:efflux RND transporter periplasmic adaptor subunit [Methylophaga sp.]MTI62974.1 efflux RND transporter periplasmic adaptor subunit [Methylophaga sp.]